MKKKHGIEDSQNSDFDCRKCGLKFKDSKSLSSHAKSHEKLYVCDACQEVFLERADLTEHKKIHLVCKICSRSCETTYALTRHMRSHKVQ